MSYAAGHVARLTSAADALSRFCVLRGVKAFLTCENYKLDADAMLLVAAPLGLRTLSYQYSNLQFPNLAMATTADRMATFAPVYHSRLTWPGLTPPEFVDVGYPFDGGFSLVAPRAAARRDRLRAAGAEFVIGLFDETVHDHKYTMVPKRDYEDQLLVLLERLIHDRSLGVVVKTQFRQEWIHSSVRLRKHLTMAAETGRFEIPAQGGHRNGILPAEVALSADIVIGQSFGGTASLEAALAGSRSVLINSYGFRGEMDSLYARAQILFPSLDAALEAIDAYRCGDPAFRWLGDWSAILSAFDPFRDGRAGRRLRCLVEESVFGTTSRDTASAKATFAPAASKPQPVVTSSMTS